MPLLAHSRIDSKSIPNILSLLSDLAQILKTYDKDNLDISPALISYAFFPLSTLLTRNEPASIPDQVLEHIFNVLEILFRWWWWTCEDAVWEQVLMIAGSIVGGLVGKGKSRERSDETKEAAARLLVRLLQNPNFGVIPTSEKIEQADARFKHLRVHAQSPKLVPVVGQTLNALLLIAGSPHLRLQLASLTTIEIIVASYIPDRVVPSVLPGIASTSTRVALKKARNTNTNENTSNAWANGAAVAGALSVLESTVVRAIGDEACTAAGIVKEIRGLEDLTEFVSGDAASNPASEADTDSPAYETRRTSSWLRASASQLLIAFNTLSPLVSHPNASAQAALASFSHTILSRTYLTLPDAQPLLLSFLLSLSISRFPRVASFACDSITTLLEPGRLGAHARLQTLTQRTASNFAALPLVLHAHDDARIQHVAGQITAAARLPAARSGVAHLLGPAGRVEKWGTRLLAVLEFVDPSASVVPVSASVAGLLEADTDSSVERVTFPETRLRLATTHDTNQAVEHMLRAIGKSGGTACLFSLEWFVCAGISTARNTGEPSSVGALWCACRIFEGVVGVSLGEGDDVSDQSHEDDSYRLEGADRRKAEKFARWVAKAATELWDKEDESEEPNAPMPASTTEDKDDQDRLAIEYVKGVMPFETRFDLQQRPVSDPSAPRPKHQPGLHKSFALQLLAISAGVLRSHFSTLLISSLYPLLHSLLPPITSSFSSAYESNNDFLASTASAALTSVAHSMGFASPRNLLLAHFDYALDGAARRLTRVMLDPHAARVLALLVRLAGKDVVERAGDVVEMCFDRLDDFHGYSIIVDGLLEALAEVVKAVAENEEKPEQDEELAAEDPRGPETQKIADFVYWLEHRKDPKPVETDEWSDNGLHPFPLGETGDKGKSKVKCDALPADRTQEKSELAPTPSTPSQSLTAQIVSRSISLLTHGSPSIRTRILSLLTLAVPILPADALLPAVHRAWPFVLNRLNDSQTAVVSAAAGLIAALAEAHGTFMAQRVWDDVWPRFRSLLAELDRADRQSALARRVPSRLNRTGSSTRVGTESAHTHAHRLYRSMLLTMSAALRGRVPVQDRSAWDVLLAFRRFLHAGAHPELQTRARELYIAFGENSSDAVWLVLTSTSSTDNMGLKHLKEKWDIQANVDAILEEIDKAQQQPMV